MLRSTATLVPYLVRPLRPVLLALVLLLIPIPTHAGSQERSAQFTTCPASMVYGELIQCAILSAAELDSYTFTASAGDELLVRVGTASGDLRPNLRLYRPDGVVACTNSSPYSPLVEISCRLPVGGTHRLEIGGTQSVQTGSYGLQIERLNPPANARPLTLAQTTSGAILSAAQLDSYTFSVNSGDRLVLRMGVSSGTLRPL